jgi:hypothetical protein
MRHSYPGLEGLLDLAQQDGVDIRPTLLRVLTDIYVQNSKHSPEDERHFTELALRLIGSTDVAVRTAVSERLAKYPAAPHAVVKRLARDLMVVAEPVLKHSPVLTPDDLTAIAKECGPAYAAAIATRAPSSDESSSEQAGDAANPAKSQAAQLCELFFAASASERRLILTNLDYAAGPTTPNVLASKEAVRGLETAALAHNTEALTRELEHALSISQALAHRVAHDQLGEPLVVAAKALGAAPDMLQRLLLLVNPVIGQSVRRVYALASLYDEISIVAAHHLVAIWRDSDPPLPRRNRAPTPWRGPRDPRSPGAGRDTLRIDLPNRAAKSERG